MKKLANEVYLKAEEVLFYDKLNSKKLGDILSNEIFYVLKQYFEIDKNSFYSKIFTDHSGDINVSFYFRAKRVLLKKSSVITDD